MLYTQTTIGLKHVKLKLTKGTSIPTMLAMMLDVGQLSEEDATTMITC